MNTSSSSRAHTLLPRFPFRAKLTLLLVVVVGVLCGFVVQRFSQIAREAAVREFRSNLMAVATMAAATINMAEHERLQRPQDQSGPDYRRVQEQLEQLRHACRYSRISDLYTMRLRHGQPIFVVDSYAPGECVIDFSDGPDVEPPKLGEVYDDPTPCMLEALRTGQLLAETEPDRDRWGTWLSAYAPLLDVHGRYVGIVGVDASAQTLAALQLRFRRQTGLFVLLALLIIPLAAYLASLQITRPIVKLVAGLNAIANGNYEVQLHLPSGDEFEVMTRACNAMAGSLKERAQMHEALVRHLSAPVARQVLDHPEQERLGGDRVEATVLVADIRQFTATLNALSPEEAVTTLNEYLQVAVEVVLAHGGTLDKFLGDGLMAVFGAPQPLPDHQLRALRCAEAMQHAICALNTQRARREQRVLWFGVGLASGEVVAGHIGSADRLEFTVIGAAVSKAHRLQALAQAGQVVLSRALHASLGAYVAVESLGPTHLKGFGDPVDVCGVQVCQQAA